MSWNTFFLIIYDVNMITCNALIVNTILHFRYQRHKFEHDCVKNKGKQLTILPKNVIRTLFHVN